MDRSVLYRADDIRSQVPRVPAVTVKPVVLKGPLNDLIQLAIQQPAREPYLLRCCDVRGIA